MTSGGSERVDPLPKMGSKFIMTMTCSLLAKSTA